METFALSTGVKFKMAPDLLIPDSYTKKKCLSERNIDRERAWQTGGEL